MTDILSIPSTCPLPNGARGHRTVISFAILRMNVIDTPSLPQGYNPLHTVTFDRQASHCFAERPAIKCRTHKRIKGEPRMSDQQRVVQHLDSWRMAVLLFALAICFHSDAANLTAADESPDVTVARLQKKAEAVVVSVQKELDKGTLRQDVIDKVQKLDGLMEKRKYQEAEALLDSVLRTLGVDPKSVPAAGPTPSAKNTQASSSGAGSLPEFDPAEFIKIFDGKTLTNWDGDPKYWTVDDGKLVGTVTPETLLEKNSWIVWRGGLVEDFELVLDYRVSAQGNSGVGYRLAVLADDPFSVRGPQADIHGANMFTGICYEENGRRLLARVDSRPGLMIRVANRG